MNDYPNVTEAVVPELQDLEELSSRTKVYEEKVRSGDFETPEAKLEAECRLVSHLKEQWAVGTDEDVQNRVAWMAMPALEQLVDLKIGRVLEGKREGSEEAEVAASEKVEQGIKFVEQYGALTQPTKDLQRNVYTKLNIAIDKPENPFVEILNQRKVKVVADRHYIVGSDGNLTRIVDYLTEVDSHVEDDRRRALVGVLSGTVRTAKQLFELVHGKEANYEAKLIRPVIDWLTSIPMDGDKLIVAFGRGAKMELHPAPNLDIEVEEPSLTAEEVVRENPEKALRQLEDISVISFYLQGYNEVLEAYGLTTISQDMLDLLDKYAPSLQRPDEIERNRKYALGQLMASMDDMESTLDLVGGIIDISLVGEKAAQAADKFLLLIESAKGRELLKVIKDSNWDIRSSLINGETRRERRLLDKHHREIWPKLTDKLAK